MSFILNALRKSEQERLAQQPDSVTGRILVNQPSPRSKTSKIIIVLLISNLIIAVSLFWFVRKETQSPLPVESDKTEGGEVAQVKPTSTPIPKIASLPQKADTKKPVPPMISAEISAPKKTVDVKLQTQKNIKPTVIVKAPASLSVQPLSMPTPAATPETAPAAPIELINSVEKIPETVTYSNAIPFLHELDPEFRHALPDLKINVYVYAEQATERFVMIDMVKYTVGSRIKDSVLLKEIRSDSVVLEYNKRLFRVKRP